MNHSPFWPLVWKEYRAGRAFWLSMAVMGIMAQGGVRWLGRPSSDRDLWLYTIALMISAGFAVGIGGTMFAAEYEERTIALLRRLPIHARQLGLAKIFTAVAGLFALVGALWLAAHALADTAPTPREAGRLWGTWGLACAEALSWGILFSLIIPRPLWATLVAAATVVAGDLAIFLPVRSAEMIPNYRTTIPIRVGLLLVVILADAVLLPAWLLGRRPALPVSRPTWRIRRPALKTLGHLAWQTLREGWLSFAMLLVPCIAVIAIYFQRSDERFVEEAGIGMVALLAIQGSLVFRADQRHGPRFLAGCGASPRMVWLSRHLVWGSWLLVWAICLLLPIGINAVALAYRALTRTNDLSRHSWGELAAALIPVELPGWIYLIVAALTVYAAGQMMSLLVRRTLLSVTFSLLLGGLLFGWIVLMDWMGASWWWSVLPLAIGFLLASWLRMPDWLIERNTARAWLKVLAAALLPVAWLCLSVPVFRAAEIPRGVLDLPNLADRPLVTAEASATLELYRQASDQWDRDRSQAVDEHPILGQDFVLHPEDEAWVKPTVELAMRASQNADLVALPVTVRFAATERIEKMENVLLLFADEQQQAGQLDTALDAYFAALRVDAQRLQCDAASKSRRPEIMYAIQEWGANAGQTTERVRQAITRLDQWHAGLPSPAELMVPIWQQSQFAIKDLPAAADAGIAGASDARWITSRIPWERLRAECLLDRLVGQELRAASMAEERLKSGTEIAALGFTHVANWGDGPTPPEWRWLGNTPLVEGTPAEADCLSWSMIHPLWRRSSGLAWRIVCGETDYRATLLILALEAWRLEHGTLPETLEELVGHGLDPLPVDPWGGQTFAYFPTGVWQVDDSWRDGGVQGKPSIVSGVWQFQLIEVYRLWDDQRGVIKFPTGTLLQWPGDVKSIFYTPEQHSRQMSLGGSGTVYFIPGPSTEPADTDNREAAPPSGAPPPTDESSPPVPQGEKVPGTP